MNIKLFMAMSLNGMIADKNGSEEFLSDTNWKSFCKLAKESGCFIVGRKTYELVQRWTDYNLDDVEARLKIVVSRDDDLTLALPFLVANSPQDAIEKCIHNGFERVILTGGSTLNSAFIEEQFVDEVILNIEPVIVGSGIPLLKECACEKRLTFIESVSIGDVLQLKYKVNKD